MKINRIRENFFPIRFSMKKYGIEWSRIGTCCELDYFIPRFLLLLHFAFRDKYYWRCDQCGKIHCIEFVSHTVPYYDKEIREQNKILDDNRCNNDFR